MLPVGKAPRGSSLSCGRSRATTTRADIDSEAHRPLKPGTILRMAVGCGIDVVDHCSHQPLLPRMARGVHAPEAWAGYLPALNPAGFALGLLVRHAG
jgi:hypothetical protein